MRVRALLNRREWLSLAAGVLLAPWPALAVGRERRFVFGSPCDLLLPAGTPAPVAAGVWRELQALNDQWHAWKPGEVSALNRAIAAGRSAPVSPRLVALIRCSQGLETLSQGCFNAGIGGLVGAWGFHDDVMRAGERPRASQVSRWAAARPSLAQLELRGGLAFSPNPLLQLDFGAVAKGVALNGALQRLRAQGVPSALLNLGGNLAAYGPGAAGTPGWRVGIRHPQHEGLLAQLDTQGQEAVVTSGSYERFRVLDGERFTHILDPHSGAPAPDLVSVTVVHPDAALADAAATALLVAGPARWPALAQRLAVDQVLVVSRSGQVSATPRLQPRLTWLG